MKVTGTGPGSTDLARDVNGAGSAAAVTSNKERRRATIAPEVDSGVSDKVAISGKAKEAAKAKAVAVAAPDVNEDKVAKLKAAVQNGTYRVDADKVADRLVDDHINTLF